MNKLETHQELISYAAEQGFDWSEIGKHGLFVKDGRFIIIYKKNGIFHYNLQGQVSILPSQYKKSAAIWRGFWDETGTLLDLEQTFQLVKSWLFDKGEHLPDRVVRSTGIG
ncbi:hypothetical protein [Candidatus Uabimicrobium sp. HlEnr_7]|uniref:hypothetical protein n=1 Tax=Candidatus Uabimicrobium helgolandensis TaxID=3095367 RepID=UPI0035569B28